jgi:hypothetical protein
MIESLIDTIIRLNEDLTLEARNYVLEGYLPPHCGCPVCYGDINEDTGDCTDPECPGPRSLAPEVLAERAFDAMLDNLSAMGVCADSISMLGSFVDAWERVNCPVGGE